MDPNQHRPVEPRTRALAAIRDHERAHGLPHTDPLDEHVLKWAKAVQAAYQRQAPNTWERRGLSAARAL